MVYIPNGCSRKQFTELTGMIVEYRDKRKNAYSFKVRKHSYWGDRDKAELAKSKFLEKYSNVRINIVRCRYDNNLSYGYTLRFIVPD